MSRFEPFEGPARRSRGGSPPASFTPSNRASGRSSRRFASTLAIAALGSLAIGCGAKPSTPAPPAPSAATRSADGPAARLERPNLVLYVVDTLRADHLGCYGYDRPTSPRLDEFAREGVRFAEARAQSSWTKPAMATLLTGFHPVTHGA